MSYTWYDALFSLRFRFFSISLFFRFCFRFRRTFIYFFLRFFRVFLLFNVCGHIYIYFSNLVSSLFSFLLFRCFGFFLFCAHDSAFFMPYDRPTLCMNTTSGPRFRCRMYPLIKQAFEIFSHSFLLHKTPDLLRSMLQLFWAITAWVFLFVLLFLLFNRHHHIRHARHRTTGLPCRQGERLPVTAAFFTSPEQMTTSQARTTMLRLMGGKTA